MSRVTYTDPEGRKWARFLPDGIPEKEARKGAPLGPPSLESLELPLALEVRLHNALFNRGLLTLEDVNRRPNEVAGAIMSALKLDAQTVMALY